MKAGLLEFEPERRVRSALSDESLRTELIGLEALPAETSSEWDDDSVWNRALILLVLANLIGERRMVDAVPDVLARMSLGDPGEMMRSIRHGIDAAFRDDRVGHVAALRNASRANEAGARYWAISWLPMVAGGDCVDDLLHATDDPCVEVAKNACSALGTVAFRSRSSRGRIAAALNAMTADERLADEAFEALQTIQETEDDERESERLGALERDGAPIRSIRTIRRCDRGWTKRCSKTWESLTSTGLPDVRACSVCERDVHFCTTDEETLEHARAGHCIARAEPDGSELPRIVIGTPSTTILADERAERARTWALRERGIREAIASTSAVGGRACPECAYPVPDFRQTCYVCNFVVGRAPR